MSDAGKERIRSTIKEIRADGSTNLSGGLFAAIGQHKNSDVGSNSFKAILLFTDGLANEGMHHTMLELVLAKP